MEETTTSTETVAQEASQNSAWRKRWGLRRLVGQPRAYLVEYGLALISTGVLLSVVISMLNMILNYKPNEYGYFSQFAYTVSISLLATLVVVVPLILVLTTRTSILEAKAPEIKNRGWRKGFLGFFLINVGLFGLGFAIAFSYDLVSYLASFGISDNNTLPWRSLLSNGIAAVLLLATVLLYSLDYRDQSGVRSLLRKLHHYGLIALAVLLSVLYLATTFTTQRAAFVDDAISNDLSSIQSKVSSYKLKNSRLPSDLSDLSLNDQQKARAHKYSYTFEETSEGYKLCAVFKTDTMTKDTGSKNTLQAYEDSTYSSYTPPQDNPQVHGKGQQCFESKVASSSSPYQYLN